MGADDWQMNEQNISNGSGFRFIFNHPRYSVKVYHQEVEMIIISRNIHRSGLVMSNLLQWRNNLS